MGNYLFGSPLAYDVACPQTTAALGAIARQPPRRLRDPSPWRTAAGADPVLVDLGSAVVPLGFFVDNTRYTHYLIRSSPTGLGFGSYSQTTCVTNLDVRTNRRKGYVAWPPGAAAARYYLCTSSGVQGAEALDIPVGDLGTIAVLGSTGAIELVENPGWPSISVEQGQTSLPYVGGGSEENTEGRPRVQITLQQDLFRTDKLDSGGRTIVDQLRDLRGLTPPGTPVLFAENGTDPSAAYLMERVDPLAVIERFPGIGLDSLILREMW